MSVQSQSWWPTDVSQRGTISGRLYVETRKEEDSLFSSGLCRSILRESVSAQEAALTHLFSSRSGEIPTEAINIFMESFENQKYISPKFLPL